ncbi:hypothetical protein [Micromonospora sp. WMMD812]|uniref:hypothetical protein n=1 Tax=Micromonospora sp. WMMD812 TaxID=3015152 RepID=UPI00248C1766|nr:hypothetical protein [Micromonospora sp. WMMD812]WBB66285.1 hypothetical protein O7603_24435 [Micromonospora sp. WMMD812]
MISSPLEAARPRAGDESRRRQHDRGNRNIAALLPAVALLTLALLTGCNQQPSSSTQAGARPVGTSWLDPAILLHPADLGPGWRESFAVPGQPAWPWDQSDCPAYRRDDYRAQSHRRDAIQRLYRMDEPSLTAHHIVESYESGWGGRALDDVRRVLRQCANYTLLGARMSFVVVETPDLGDGALVVRGRIDRDAAPPTVAYFVTVRRGDTVSTLNLPDPGRQAAVDAIAARQVARLG